LKEKEKADSGSLDQNAANKTNGLNSNDSIQG
jgi:hypothetical protein